jgi:aryl-alcohol dehydrogenase-like predicted oxidoreductase
VNYRKLGNSDLQVSEIALGSWLTYSGGVEKDRARDCISAAFEVGINFLDTANIYGRGASETFLGEVLRGRDRESYVLATKLYFPMTPVDSGLSAKQVRKQLEDSLRRLRTDYVDLYQCHRWDPNIPLDETMEALSEMVSQGKTRYIGFSEWTPEQIQQAISMKGVEKFVSSQPQYSALYRKPESDVFALCHENGIGQIVWSPLGQGILTGKYLPGEKAPKDSRAASSDMNGFFRTDDKQLTAVQRLREVAEASNLTMVQLALAWVLRRPEVSSAIIGATRPEQVHANAAASGVKLSQEQLSRIDEILNPVLVHA